MSDVTLRGVSVAYEGAPAVDGLDLQVTEGQWLSLIGPNGAGKTSVLRAIANLVPFTGLVEVGGRSVRTLGRRELARKVSMLVQEPEMPAGMTVAHYVLLGRSAHLGYLGKESDRDRRIVAETLQRLALEGLSARPVDHLSGGAPEEAMVDDQKLRTGGGGELEELRMGRDTAREHIHLRRPGHLQAVGPVVVEPRGLEQALGLGQDVCCGRAHRCGEDSVGCAQARERSISVWNTPTASGRGAAW